LCKHVLSILCGIHSSTCRGRDRAQVAKDLEPVYIAASEAEALDRFTELSCTREKRYPAIIRLRENAWADFVPFLRCDREIRTVICTTNANEELDRPRADAAAIFPPSMLPSSVSTAAACWWCRRWIALMCVPGWCANGILAAGCPSTEAGLTLHSSPSLGLAPGS